MILQTLQVMALSLSMVQYRVPYEISSDLLDAIRTVESNGRRDVPDGDGGKSIGEFQIMEAYFKDAAEYDQSLGNDYSRCRERLFAERVVRAYMRRYFSDGATAREIAMAHNGGPRIGKKKGTKAYQRAEVYWGKVQKALYQ